MFRVVLFWCVCDLLSPLFSYAYASENETQTNEKQYQSVEPIHGSAWTPTLENDLFRQEDGGYTGGIALNVAHGPHAEFSKQSLSNWLYRVVEGSYIATLSNRCRR